MQRRYRVVIAKPGLDGHDRGAKVIARALRDAGFEVIYTGLFQTPESVAEAVLQEDADAVGLSLLSGAHMTLIPKIVDGLRDRGLADVLVFAGGIIPNDDIATLRDAGFEVIYTGLFQTPDSVDEAVLQEDADAVGLSLLSGAHMTLIRKVVDELRDRDLADVLVFAGGIIPDADIETLREGGVAAIFTPGSRLADITAWLETALDSREAELSK